MKKLLYSPVVAAIVLSAGLITSALIVSRAETSRASGPAPATSKTPEQLPTEQQIKSQFVDQMTRQTGSSAITDLSGKKQLLDAIVIDKFQMAPLRNRVDIDYHFAWQNTDVATYTQMSLRKDEFGRFDSGDVYSADKHFRIVVR